MKIKIIDILNKIANNENIPNRILYKQEIWEYNKQDDDYSNYAGENLFDEYVIATILNDEVEILETTITWKPDKIEKLEEEHFSYSYEIINKINEIIEVLNER